MLAEAKSIYGPDTTGNKYKQPSGLLDEANLVRAPHQYSSQRTFGEVFTILEKAPTRALSWLKTATIAYYIHI